MSGDHERSAFEILSVRESASFEEIRAAYLKLVAQHPPEAPDGKFELLADAYRRLSDPQRRAQTMLESSPPNEPLIRLVKRADRKAAYVGLGPWLEAMKG